MSQTGDARGIVAFSIATPPSSATLSGTGPAGSCDVFTCPPPRHLSPSTTSVMPLRNYEVHQHSSTEMGEVVLAASPQLVSCTPHRAILPAFVGNLHRPTHPYSSDAGWSSHFKTPLSRGPGDDLAPPGLPMQPSFVTLRPPAADPACEAAFALC